MIYPFLFIFVSDMREIIVNSIKTPDGTILKSRNRHDYVRYIDDNGETYIVDGGCDYLKRSQNIEPYEELSLYNDSEFDLIRNRFDRFNTRTGSYVNVSDMSDEWISNLIVYLRDRQSDEDFPLWVYLTEERYRKIESII